MVSKNPLYKIWNGKRFRATVIDDIFPQVLFYTGFSVLVTFVSAKTHVHLGVSNQLLTVLGIVLGLVITFRTTSAYEKYQDGRQMWTDIMTASKYLAQLIWIHVPVERTEKDGKAWTKIQVMTEKKTMINLIQAYAVSVKHFLRGEQGIKYEDLYPFVAFLEPFAHCSDGNQQPDFDPMFSKRDTDLNIMPLSPVVSIRYGSLRKPSHNRGLSDATTINPHPTEAVSSEKPSKPMRLDIPTIPTSTAHDVEQGKHTVAEGPMSIMPKVDNRILEPYSNRPDVCFSDYFPVFKLFSWIYCRVVYGKNAPQRTKRRRAYAGIVESDVPMQIALVLSDYSAYLMRGGHIDQQIAGAMTSNLLLLQNTVSNLERICNTPLPWAYQVHLQVTLGIYLILLPFQIYDAFKYITIPATFFTSFLLLGFLEIGQEIENPFNYDENDLDLDGFCFSLHRDLHAITTYKSPFANRSFFNERNKPFAPSLDKTASEISGWADSDKYMELQSHMLDSWQKVDSATRPARRR